MTTVVHCKKHSYDVLIDRTTEFGNPFKLSASMSLGRSLERFKGYFYARMYYDLDFYNQVVELKDKTLGCWCKPLACHGDIIAAYLDGTNDAEW